MVPTTAGVIIGHRRIYIGLLLSVARQKKSMILEELRLQIKMSFSANTAVVAFVIHTSKRPIIILALPDYPLLPGGPHKDVRLCKSHATKKAILQDSPSNKRDNAC